MSYRSLVGIIIVAFPFFIGDEKLPSFNTEPKNISCLKQKNTNKVAQNKKATKMPANQDDCLRLK